MRCFNESAAAVLLLVSLPVAAETLLCFGKTDKAASASVRCIDPTEVRGLTGEIKYAHIFAADGKTALKRWSALLVDCKENRAFEVDGLKIEAVEFAAVAKAICTASAKPGRAP